jgi:hypothetical protein
VRALARNEVRVTREVLGLLSPVHRIVRRDRPLPRAAKDDDTRQPPLGFDLPLEVEYPPDTRPRTARTLSCSFCGRWSVG